MTTALDKKVIAGFTFALIILSVIGVASYRSVVRQRRDVAMVEHTHRVILGLEVLYSASTDAQNGHRGFAVTGDDSFLAPYLRATETLDTQVQRVRELTADNPAQQRQVDTLAPLLRDQLAWSSTVIAARRQGGFPAAQHLMLTGEGKRLTEAIHAVVATMQRAEETLLEERESRASRSARLTQWIIIAGSVLAFVFVGLALLVLTRDLAARRRAEEVLRETAQLGDLVQLLDEASLIVCDLDDRILRWNAGCQRLYGFPASVAIGFHSHGLLETHFPEPLPQIQSKLMATGRWAGELRQTTAHGDEIVVASEWVLWRDAMGQPTAILKANTDVTERKKAEESLRASQAQLETIVENLSEGLVVSDMDGQVLHFNRAALHLHGYASLDECRRRLPEFADTFALSDIEGVVLPVVQWPLARILRGEELRDVEINVRHLRQGWERVFSYGGTLVRNAAGEPTLAVIAINDVTNRKHAEQDIRRLNAELEERVRQRTAQLQAVNKELETFAYSVSHDLKAPLRAIDGYSRLLLDEQGPKLDAEGLAFLNNVRSGAQTMGQLIEGLLAYSRIERRAVQHDLLDLGALVEAALAERSDEIERCGTRIDIAVPPVKVRADREGLGMALRNLVGNALKFSRDARPPVIEIGAETRNGTCRLWVKDNGIGFDMKFSDKIFEIFQRLERSETYEGTGVGLALVRKAMERMGGRAWAESVPGQGATFFLELPT